MVILKKKTNWFAGGGPYQLCTSPTGECLGFPSLDMYTSDSRPNRPTELRLTPSSTSINNENAVVAVKSPSTPYVSEISLFNRSFFLA